jgi:glycosyltransferase involved in cell wall biosynthesis
MSKRLRILFAPNYRAGNPYQALLAEALIRKGIEVTFLSDYYRGLPLFRGTQANLPDIVHLHWPEAYFPQRGDRWDSLRIARYPMDFWLTAHYRPIVLTAHNLLPHNRSDDRGVLRNVRFTAQNSKAIFVHSKMALQMTQETFAISDDRIRIIPFGDHAVSLGPPLPRDEARIQLQMPLHTKVCLVFGTVSPYKGTDELVRLWAEKHLPYRLVVIGPILSEAFANQLYGLAQGCGMIDLRLLNEWLDDATLRAWLSASDCSIFNYREIFSSGAAGLARSYGLPLLIPRRLTSVDLDEPHPHVFRFDALSTDFRTQLERALATPCDYNLADEWRRKTNWEEVAEATACVYHDVLNSILSNQVNAENRLALPL